MPTKINSELHGLDDWIFRFKPATDNPSRLVLMLHGWTGDENSMWIFTHKFTAQAAILAPRGLYKDPKGGYSWRENNPETRGFPWVEDLRPSAEAVVRFVDDWSRISGVCVDQFDLIGFSQGAALSLVMAILFPERIRAMAILSGFMPQGAKNLLARRPLVGKSIYVAHGRQDNLIPVEQARNTVELLQESGAQVTYCESDSGHKVSVDCFNGMTNMVNQKKLPPHVVIADSKLC